MVNLPRNRRSGGSDSSKGKGKREQKEKGLRWQHHLTIFILIAAISIGFVYFYNAGLRSHYPAKLQTAKCLFDDSAPFFVHCKDREQHNRELLQHIVGSVVESDAKSIADASVALALSQSMRTGDIELAKELFSYMSIATNHIQCYKLIDVASIDFQNESPRSVCAAAVFKKEGEAGNEKALEAFNSYNDVIFLMAMYGSELHEGSMRYTYEGSLPDQKGESMEAPKWSSYIHNFYYHYSLSEIPLPFSYLMIRLAETRNNSEEERLGTSSLAIELRKSLAAMRRCNPPANITWMEYHSRSAFKRAYYEDMEDNCEWASVEDTFLEKVGNLYYDINYRIRRMMSMRS